MSEKAKKSGGVLKCFFWMVFILIAAVVICCFGFFYVTNKGMKLTKDSFMEMFHTFRPKKVIHSFTEYRDLKVKGTEGNILEVATGEEIVELTREGSFQLFSKTIPKLKAVSSIMVPATFRYHIDLNGDWDIIDDGNRLHVIAPPLIPSLPVAFDTTKMEKTNPGWSKLISGSNMEVLEKTITPQLGEIAKDPKHIDEFEPAAKKSIAKFLQTWLSNEDHWEKGKFEEIIVYFTGEIVDPANRKTVPDMKIDEPEAVLP